MTVVDGLRPRTRVARMTLGLLLTVVTVAHVAQALESPVANTSAGSIGAAVAYAAIAVCVFCGSQLGYIAAVGLPLAGLVYSDHGLFSARTPVGILYSVLFAVIVPLAAYLWYRSASHSDNN